MSVYSVRGCTASSLIRSLVSEVTSALFLDTSIFLYFLSSQSPWWLSTIAHCGFSFLGGTLFSKASDFSFCPLDFLCRLLQPSRLSSIVSSLCKCFAASIDSGSQANSCSPVSNLRAPRVASGFFYFARTTERLVHPDWASPVTFLHS